MKNQGNWIRRSNNGITIVFIHGINSSEQCWKNKENQVYWPELLKDEKHLSSIGIYVFSYQTGIFSGNYSLGDVVDSLKVYLRLDQVINSPKIIFACHSMGGIIARRFLVREQVYLYKKSLRQVGLFLIASPSLGSEYANMLSILAGILRNTQVKALEFSQQNTWLNDLDKDFLNLKEGGNISIKGRELIEDKSVILSGQQVVKTFSGARYFAESYRVPGSDHFTIATPESQESIQHRLLCEFIYQIINSDLNKSEQPSENKPNLSTGQTDLESSTIHNNSMDLRESLKNCEKSQFDEIIYDLSVPSGSVPSETLSQAERTNRLLNWAKSTTGCGLEKVREVSEKILGVKINP